MNLNLLLLYVLKNSKNVFLGDLYIGIFFLLPNCYGKVGSLEKLGIILIETLNWGFFPLISLMKNENTLQNNISRCRK